MTAVVLSLGPAKIRSLFVVRFVLATVACHGDILEVTNIFELRRPLLQLTPQKSTIFRAQLKSRSETETRPPTWPTRPTWPDGLAFIILMSGQTILRAQQQVN